MLSAVNAFIPTKRVDSRRAQPSNHGQLKAPIPDPQKGFA